MKINFILMLCVFAFTALCVFSQQNLTGKVVGVVDGDTITVMTKDKRQLVIRLSGADAPEKDQDFGQNARQFLADKVINQTVSVSGLKPDCLDRYAAAVSLNGKNLSIMLVESGNAWADIACQTDKTLVAAETVAREKKIGLWQNLNPVRPSEFLKSTQSPARSAADKSDRRIFTGLAPSPAAPPPGMYIGMTVESFMSVCGEEKGTKSDTYIAAGRQSFSVSIPVTADNAKKTCRGSFHFGRFSQNQPFKLEAVFQ